MAPACPPGRSQARTPRGRPSPTATSAGSASGSPARCRRTGPTPGSSSPVGQPCVGAVSTVSTDSVREEKYPSGKIISLKMTPDSWRKLLTQNWLNFAEANLCLCHQSDRDLGRQSQQASDPYENSVLFSAISVLFRGHFKQKTTSIMAKSSSRHCEISDDVLVTESFQVPGPPALAPRPHTPLHRGSSRLSPKSRHFNLHTASFFLLLLVICVTRSHDTIKKKRKNKTKQNSTH